MKIINVIKNIIMILLGVGFVLLFLVIEQL